MHKHAVFALAALLCAWWSPAHAQAVPPARSTAPVRIPAPSQAMRDAFDAVDGAAINDAPAAELRHQPLGGWLEYAYLRRMLDTLPPARGNGFLERNRDTPAGEAFRNEWLAALAKRGAWAEFQANWRAGITSASLRCQSLQARQASGQVDAQWTADAQALWRSSGSSLPSACDGPFAQLASAGGLGDALRWERFDLAADDAQAAVMRTIARGMSGADATLASTYAAYIDAADASAANWPRTPRSKRVAVAGLAKLAKASPDRAEARLPPVAQALGFSDAERGKVLYQVALWTVASSLPESARRLAAVPDVAYDASLHEWRVREALARSDWRAALAAIRRMPDAQRNDSRWLYLAARTGELTGDPAGARAAYAQAAKKADFHGFLAADRLDQPYALCPWQPPLTLAAKQAIARDPAMVRALQLHALGRKSWAQREWDAALSRFSDEQRRIAVEVAQDNGWFDRGVFGLVNVGGKRYPEEQQLYLLRFPLHHDASIRREAGKNNLDPAWIAAEIRAESVFDPNARSSADARGLMQVLPATGAGVAAKIGMPWKGGDSLYDADTNIAIGSAYLRQLMDKYGGKPYQVIAGYNAGPAPLGRWMSQRPAMDPDFWIETISYKETREYVARVLSFSTLYDWRLNGDAARVSDRLLGIGNGPRKAFACTATPPAAPPAPAPATGKPPAPTHARRSGRTRH